MEKQTCPVVHLDPAGADIHADAAKVHALGGVARVMLPQGVMAWSVTSYELAKQVLADPMVSKDPNKHWPAYMAGEIPAHWALASWVAMDNMTTRHGAEHARLRKLIARAFTPKRTEAMRPAVEKTVATLLDELDALPRGEAIDLKKYFSYQLPARIICDLFGVPEEHREAALRGGEVAVESAVSGEEAEANVQYWTQTLAGLIEQKRAQPGDDMTTVLIEAVEEDGTRLTQSELVGTLFLSLGAGSETVMNMMTSAIRELLLHPDQYELVQTGVASWSDVIEETLRKESPIAQLPLRFAMEDIKVGDQVIPAGDAILIGFAGAGRDPELHGETADKFDLMRENKEHLSFSHGIHFCLGAQLARLEAGVALPALFERFPDLRLAVAEDDLEVQGTLVMNGNRTLPVYLHARVPAAV